MWSTTFHHSKILIVFALAILFLGSCRKHEPPPVDPCKNAQPFIADFDILEQVGDSLVQTDTVLKYNRIYFRAKGTYDSVKWTVGNYAKVYSGKEFFVSFLNPFQGSIKMTGYRKPNITCFPDEKSIITVSKTLNVFDRDGTAAICGLYKGFIIGQEADTFSARVQYVDTANYQKVYHIKNFPKGCLNYVPYPVYTFYAPYSGLPIQSPVGYSSFVLDRLGSMYSYCAPAVSGFAQLIKKDTLYIKFFEPVPPDVTPSIKIYKGIRQ